MLKTKDKVNRKLRGCKFVNPINGDVVVSLKLKWRRFLVDQMSTQLCPLMHHNSLIEGYFSKH